MTKSVKTLHLGVIGPGLVGSEFLAQIHRFQAKPTCPLEISVVGICNSKRQLLSPAGLDLGKWQSSLTSSIESSDLNAFASHVAGFKNGVLIDCTASDLVAKQYPSWIKKGLHLITPNKKAFASDLELWNQIQKLQELHQVSILHESSVGCVHLRFYFKMIFRQSLSCIKSEPGCL